MGTRRTRAWSPARVLTAVATLGMATLLAGVALALHARIVGKPSSPSGGDPRRLPT